MHLVLADIDGRGLRDLARTIPGATAVRADVSRMSDVESLASEALVQDLALRRARIGVSVLCPGWVATRLAQSAPGADAVLRSLIAQGQRPEAVAERAVRAIRSGEFYVLTHPEMAPAVQRRAEAILAGRAPAAPALRPPRSRAASR